MTAKMKLIAKDIVPTREDIRKRFEKRLGGIYSLYFPLTAIYAEETERLIMELWLTNDSIKEPIGPVHIQKRPGAGNYRYKCPACKGEKIKSYHNYCPRCGAEINWIA